MSIKSKLLALMDVISIKLLHKTSKERDVKTYMHI